MSYFLNNGSQRHVGRESVHAGRGQLRHTAAVGAFDGQAQRAPDGGVAGHLEQVVQAVFAESMGTRQDARVREERVAHRAGQVLLHAVHHRARRSVRGGPEASC